MIEAIDQDNQTTETRTYTTERVTEDLKLLHQASLQLAAGFGGALPMDRKEQVEAMLEATSALNEMLLAVNHLTERLRES